MSMRLISPVVRVISAVGRGSELLRRRPAIAAMAVMAALGAIMHSPASHGQTERRTTGIPGFKPPTVVSPGEPSDESEGFNDSRDKVNVMAQAGVRHVLPGGDVPVAIVFDIAP